MKYKYYIKMLEDLTTEPEIPEHIIGDAESLITELKTIK